MSIYRLYFTDSCLLIALQKNDNRIYDLIRAEVVMTSAFYIKERDYMSGMKGIYKFNHALIGAIIGLIIDLILCTILP